ncbi:MULTISPECIES: transglycosylase domain-containing protein [unclassified Lysobacter]|uniref:transglycosylase domain-containing protein n=1 Tax=unclassified Lysobacter TaxID=2635362 RepID=UPI00070B2D87|nr:MULTISPECIES: transglycosylase domain-containing protein [unclassified Lysobacter]KRD30521.1 hypothetical protein ASE35_17550 [Lysobacter sp. Root916]KRD80254.1 hypothetical protein ASE43_05145 [Lysobacter sp. Root983]
MGGWLKGIVGAALLLTGCFVCFFYGLYWYGASALPQELPRAQRSYPDEVRAIYWASLGGEGPMRAERLDPLKLIWLVFRGVQHDRRPNLVSEYDLSSSVSRQIVLEHTPDLRGARWHLAGIAATIRVSNERSAEQIADFALDRAWMGRDARGLGEASHAYFGVPFEQTTQAERIALIALMRGPSYFDPSRNPERFRSRYAYVAQQFGVSATDIDLQRDLVRLKPTATAR